MIMRRLEIEHIAKKRIGGVLPKKYQMPDRSGMIHWRTEPSEERKDFLAWQERQRRKLIKRLLCAAVVLAVLFSLAAWRGRDINKGYMDINTITSYEQLYRHYMGLLEKPDYFSHLNRLSAVMGAMNSEESTGAASAAQSASDFTAMNTREEAIGEGDYAVTDGKYIYGLSYSRCHRVDCAYRDCIIGDEPEDSNNDSDGTEEEEEQEYAVWLHVLVPDGEDTVEIVDLDLPISSVASEGSQMRVLSQKGEIYVKDDILVVVQQIRGEMIWDTRTWLLFYDISKPLAPQLIKSNVQYGEYNTCRESEGVFYLVTRRQNSPLTAEMKKEQRERYIPMIDGKELAVQDIYMQKDSQGNAYSIISSWSMEQKGKRLDAKALIGFYSDIYMTKENLYASNTVYADITGDAKKTADEKTDYTRITKFCLKNGAIVGKAMTQVPGSITSSFGIQEKGDALFVAAQVQHYKYDKEEESYILKGQDIGVYALDDKLCQTGALEGLASGEEIKSVRFVKDICYLVSYYQTDPLFSIDLSDPAKLKVLDELKMPGYSAYLHPVADNMLLGIGRNDEENKVKLALYDISDVKQLKECDVKEIDFEWVNANLEDYRKIFLDEENQIVGLCGGDYEENGGYYVLYHYDSSGRLEKKDEYELEYRENEDELEADVDAGCIGLRIGSYFYVIVKYTTLGGKPVYMEETLRVFPYSKN